MAGNPWGTPNITVEKVLDDNPNLHLQNAENALKSRDFQSASKHIGYARQTACGRKDILEQCDKVMQVVQMKMNPDLDKKQKAKLDARFEELLKNYPPEYVAKVRDVYRKMDNCDSTFVGSYNWFMCLEELSELLKEIHDKHPENLFIMQEACAVALFLRHKDEVATRIQWCEDYSSHAAVQEERIEILVGAGDAYQEIEEIDKAIHAYELAYQIDAKCYSAVVPLVRLLSDEKKDSNRALHVLDDCILRCDANVIQVVYICEKLRIHYKGDKNLYEQAFSSVEMQLKLFASDENLRDMAAAMVSISMSESFHRKEFAWFHNLEPIYSMYQLSHEVEEQLEPLVSGMKQGVSAMEQGKQHKAIDLFCKRWNAYNDGYQFFVQGGRNHKEVLDSLDYLETYAPRYWQLDENLNNTRAALIGICQLSSEYFSMDMKEICQMSKKYGDLSATYPTEWTDKLGFYIKNVKYYIETFEILSLAFLKGAPFLPYAFTQHRDAAQFLAESLEVASEDILVNILKILRDSFPWTFRHINEILYNGEPGELIKDTPTSSSGSNGTTTSTYRAAATGAAASGTGCLIPMIVGLLACFSPIVMLLLFLF